MKTLLLFHPTAQNHRHALHDVILLCVVWYILGGDFEYCGNELAVVAQGAPNFVGYVLVDEQYANVLASSEFVERLLDHAHIGVRLDHQEVASLDGAVANARKQEPRYRVLFLDVGDLGEFYVASVLAPIQAIFGYNSN